MNAKAIKFNEFLTANNINCFQVQEFEDELNSVLYRSFMEVNGQNLPTRVVVDNSIYVLVQVRVATTVINEANRTAVMEHINRLNDTFKVFKYYINENGDIVIESCIPSTNEEFVPGLVHVVLLEVILRHLQEEYARIMKLVWAN